MTDLEITTLCAGAMRVECWGQGDVIFLCDEESTIYQPLYNDAQAMALVKKFRLFISHDETEFWVEWAGQIGGESKLTWRADLDLNRAICECVAKMQKANQGT